MKALTRRGGGVNATSSLYSAASQAGSMIRWKHGERINNKGSTEEGRKVLQAISNEKFMAWHRWKKKQG